MILVQIISAFSIMLGIILPSDGVVHLLIKCAVIANAIASAVAIITN